MVTDLSRWSLTRLLGLLLVLALPALGMWHHHRPAPWHSGVVGTAGERATTVGAAPTGVSANQDSIARGGRAARGRMTDGSSSPERSRAVGTYLTYFTAIARAADEGSPSPGAPSEPSAVPAGHSATPVEGALRGLGTQPYPVRDVSWAEGAEGLEVDVVVALPRDGGPSDRRLVATAALLDGRREHGLPHVHYSFRPAKGRPVVGWVESGPHGPVASGQP